VRTDSGDNQPEESSSFHHLRSKFYSATVGATQTLSRNNHRRSSHHCRSPAAHPCRSLATPLPSRPDHSIVRCRSATTGDLRPPNPQIRSPRCCTADPWIAGVPTTPCRRPAAARYTLHRQRRRIYQHQQRTKAKS
jgi:hypothetical protein